MPASRALLLFAALLSLPFRVVAAQRPAAPPANALVDAAISAMGGDSLLGTLRTSRVDGVFHEYILGNAERNEGPFRTRYGRFSELRDAGNHRLRRTELPVTNAAAPPTPLAYIIADSLLVIRVGAREIGGQPILYDDFADQAATTPEHAVMTARSAAGLRSEGAAVRYGVTHDVVSWPYSDGRLRMELDRDSHLPTRISVTRTYPRDFRRAQLGDVTVSYEFTNWTQEAGGLVYPRQIISRVNGEPLRDVTISTIAGTAAAPPDSFAYSDSARVQWTRNVASSPPQFQFGSNGTLPDVVDGVARVKEFWSTTLVRQDDGVLIFEAHLSGQHLREVIAESARRWPGAKVKGLVMSSDPWAHLGGVREAVALGIPIYVSGRSIPALTALLKTPHTLAPDALARTPRAPRFVPVDAKLMVGTGANRVELYPVRGAYAERMTMVYFPAHKLLYGADLVFAARPPGSGYARTAAIDLLRAVAREGLAVDSLFCVQPSPVIAWKDFVAAPK